MEFHKSIADFKYNGDAKRIQGIRILYNENSLREESLHLYSVL